jgi:K+-sensing histidine kinase KdpD
MSAINEANLNPFQGNTDNLKSVNNNILNSLSLLTGMSHEIRTYINAIVGFSSLLRLGANDDAESMEIKDLLFKSCEQLTELFDSFLDSAIIENGGLETDLQVCNLNHMLTDLVSEFKEVLIKDGNKDVIIESESQSADNSEALIDSAKVLKAIRCLIMNAVKNTKSGHIKVGYDIGNGTITFYIIDSSYCYYKYREFIYSDDMNKSLKIFFDTNSAINIILAKKLIHYLQGNLWINWNGFTGTGIYFSVPAKINATQLVKNPTLAKPMNVCI